MNFDGSGLRYVGGGHSPAWSPDGRVVFTGVSGFDDNNGWRVATWALYVMNSDGSGVTQLLDRSSSGRAAWSPDGRSMAFGGWILDADGSDLRELEALPDRVSAPAWSPDGSRIAFMTDPGPWQVCVWLPDTFGCEPGPGVGKSSVIYSYHVAGADWEVIDAIYPAPAVLAANPDWSPDGSQLVFDMFDLTRSPTCWGSGCPRFDPDRRRIFTLSVETGEVRRLIPEAANPAVADYKDYAAVWSRETP
jgi:Tol biopolymer transport system component